MSSTYEPCLKPLEDFLHIQVTGHWKPKILDFDISSQKSSSIELSEESPILVRIQPHAGGGGWWLGEEAASFWLQTLIRRVRNVNGNEIKLAGEVGRARPWRCRLLVDCTSQICKYSRIVKYKVCGDVAGLRRNVIFATSRHFLSFILRASHGHTSTHRTMEGQWQDRKQNKTKTFLLSEKIFFVRIRVGLCTQKREIAAVLLLPPFVENMLGHPSIVNCV